MAPGGLVKLNKSEAFSLMSPWCAVSFAVFLEVVQIKRLSA